MIRRREYISPFKGKLREAIGGERAGRSEAMTREVRIRTKKAKSSKVWVMGDGTFNILCCCLTSIGWHLRSLPL